jgi:hypothetical protein
MKLQKKHTFLKLLIAILAFGVTFAPVPSKTLVAQAAGNNLINNPSFETEVTTYWDTWSAGSSTRRNFTMTRSYEVPVGYGSYSAAIQGSGSPEARFNYGIITNSDNPITLTSGKNYVFSFYAKAQTRSTVSVYLVNSQTFESVSTPVEINIGGNWAQHQVIFTSNYSGPGALTFAFGDLGENTILNIDGLSLTENNITLNTNQTISGYIGDTNRNVRISGGSSLTLNDVKVELPFFNEQTNQIETKQFTPTSVTSTQVKFDMPVQTFAGIGKIYVYGGLVGNFNYNVKVKITDFAPNPVRVDEDFVVYGSGFNPVTDQTFVLVQAVGGNGNVYDLWLKPHTIDSRLSQLVVKLPIGVTNGRVSVKTFYTDLSNVGKENRSGNLSYVIKPSIYNVEWSRAGYEQVGDKISIYGKGIAKSSTVNFYNENNEIIYRKSASIKEINTTENYEVIEVATPVTLNKLKITVKVGSIESDQADALQITARPVITTLTTQHKRKVSYSNTSLPAAKPGEKIRINGKGFKTTAAVTVEIETVNGRIAIPLYGDAIDQNGNWAEFTVPSLATTGTINVEVNGRKSNSVTLEIIPIIVSTLPLAPFPGTDLNIWTQGVGLNTSQVTVYFKLNNNETVAVTPSNIRVDSDAVIITVPTPKSISNHSSSVKIKYGNWLNDETYDVSAQPFIDSATMDMETKIISIKGHGFAARVNDNKITYMYADHTVVTPRVRMLGITTTGEGQELKIQVLDDYYYGFIKLSVNEEVSNEVTLGPAKVTRIERRVQFVNAENRVMGVLYISGKNFGPTGGVKVGDVWANVHYRTNTFIIAVVESSQVNYNPVIVAK